MPQSLLTERYFGGRYFGGRYFAAPEGDTVTVEATGRYAGEHRSALADIRAAGAAVTFTKVTPGTHDSATGLFGAPTTTTVAGYAVQVRPKSDRDRRAYEATNLTPSDAPMLLFAASTYGDAPPLGATCRWNGRVYTVRAFGDEIAPDGVPILTRPVVSR